MKKYLVWGMGLLGTSLALDLKKRGHRVIAVEKSPEYLEVVRRSGFEESYHSDSPEIYSQISGCDGIIIATPVDQVMPILGLLRNQEIPADTWITDMASTKSELMNAVNQSGFQVSFVGSHPMAGSDLSGPSNARQDLFLGSTIFVTPPDSFGHNHPAVISLRQFWEALGAHPHTISPHVHDKWAAYLSHGLHLVSCMVSCLLDDIPDVYDVSHSPAGGSFRDITRVAGSNPELWDGIIKSNSKEVGKYLESLESLVREWREKLVRDELPIREIFQKSAGIRSKVLKNNAKNKEDNHGNHRA